MTDINPTLEHPNCPGCGQPLTVSKGITICRTEDGVQASEVNPEQATFARDEIIDLDGTKIINPFGTKSTRIIGIFDRAHSIRFEQQKRDWYPEQYTAV